MNVTLTVTELARHDAIISLTGVIAGGVFMGFGAWLRHQGQPISTVILLIGAALLIVFTGGP